MYVKKINTKMLNDKGLWVNDETVEKQINDFINLPDKVFYNITGNVDYVLIVYDDINAKEEYIIHNENLKVNMK